ncbi:MAG: PstS family phosphate ABC transporter substrate-binding protein [Dehalococcoidia bacterium]
MGRRSTTAPGQALILVAAVLAVTAVACGDRHEPGENISNSGIDYGALGGDIDIDGSSTVFPITQAMAEEFSYVANTHVNVGLSGTGGGFEKFCRGDTDMSNASRPIKENEVQACAENGIDDIVEFQVAIDALTVVVNDQNDWATCMTVEQLTNAFRRDGATRWSELDPTWPDAEIIAYYPGADSGTFDYFVEVLEGEREGSTHRSDGTSSEDDNVLARGVEGDKNAVGYFGFAYFQESGDRVKPVAIDGGEGCVEPTFQSALEGAYKPLSRPLFLYTRQSYIASRPEILGFLDFYYAELDAIVEEVGYVTLPADLKQEQEAKFAQHLPR